MRRYSIEILSETRGESLHLVLVSAPQWTRWLIRASYWVMSLTRDRYGAGLVSRAYELYDRFAQRFPLPATPRAVDEFRRWSRRR